MELIFTIILFFNYINFFISCYLLFSASRKYLICCSKYQIVLKELFKQVKFSASISSFPCFFTIAVLYWNYTSHCVQCSARFITISVLHYSFLGCTFLSVFASGTLKNIFSKVCCKLSLLHWIKNFIRRRENKNVARLFLSIIYFKVFHNNLRANIISGLNFFIFCLVKLDFYKYKGWACFLCQNFW